MLWPTFRSRPFRGWSQRYYTFKGNSRCLLNAWFDLKLEKIASAIDLDPTDATDYLLIVLSPYFPDSACVSKTPLLREKMKGTNQMKQTMCG